MPACAACGRDNPDDARFCLACGNAFAPAEGERELRKTVTVLFCDIVGYTATSEALDPEALRALQTRYFDEARAAIERHGGSVEKFVGDAVMAVFGVPHVHEDDALRALRAAVELRTAVELLGLETRIGINSGEVVAGAGDALVTGDAVNVAARLQQAAATGAILLDDTTYTLVRDAVEVAPLGPLQLKGKEQAVEAFRVESLDAEAAGFSRRLDSRFVGRSAELSQLTQAYRRAVDQRTCVLATIFGTAGIGKSRLVAEVSAVVTGEARVLAGRCLPYGEGITYWPLAEVLAQAGLDRNRVGELFAGDPAAASLAEHAAALTGAHSSGASADELLWTVRRLVERLTADGPLVLVLEDLHWAEQAFLDLVDGLADSTPSLPLLIVAVARPELLERRPTWGGGKVNAVAMLLEALSTSEAEEFATTLLETNAADVERILAAAEGNPLFIEQLLAMASDAGELSVPPTIHALLASRIDMLAEPERRTLECAAVIGAAFSISELERLGGEPSLLPALARKELLRIGDEGTVRFRHQLIRDAAYDALPKRVRAELHERYGELLEQALTAEELAGYHLEQGVRNREEVGLDVPTDLALRASAQLAAAGRRAVAIEDLAAAANLLDRASRLAPTKTRPRVETLIELADVLATSDADRSARAAADAVEESRAIGDSTLELVARAEIAFRKAFGGAGELEFVAGLIEDGLPTAEAAGNVRALARLYDRLGLVYINLGRSRDAERAFERALELAEAADDSWRLRGVVARMSLVAMMGAIRADEAAGRLERLVRELELGPARTALLHARLAWLHAVQGNRDRAAEHLEAARALREEVGIADPPRENAETLRVLGDADAAEAALRSSYDALRARGEVGQLPAAAAELASLLLERDRPEEAALLIAESEELAVPDDVETQALVRTAKGRLFARSGRYAEAAELAAEGVRVIEATELLHQRGLAFLGLAEVLRAAGRSEDAADAARLAAERFEEKGSVAFAQEASALARELSGETISQLE